MSTDYNLFSKKTLRFWPNVWFL